MAHQFTDDCAKWELRNIHEWRWREENKSIHAIDCPSFKGGVMLPDSIVREMWRMAQLTGDTPRNVGYFNCGNGQCTTVRR